MRSPHDRLFSFTFRNAQHAACWLRSVLPPLLTAAIDWATPAPLRERFPGVRLRPHLADAGFAAALDLAGEPYPIALLIEPKSHDDAEVGQQLLRYTIHLQRALQQQPGRPPFVVPVLLRHGEPRRQAPPRGGPLHDLLLQASPHQRVVVDDLTTVSEAELAARRLTPLAELTLSRLKVLPQLPPDEVPRAFERWQHLLRAIDHLRSPPLAPPPRLELWADRLLDARSLADVLA